jgi:hypothetical protein
VWFFSKLLRGWRRSGDVGRWQAPTEEEGGGKSALADGVVIGLGSGPIGNIEEEAVVLSTGSVGDEGLGRWRSMVGSVVQH